MQNAEEVSGNGVIRLSGEIDLATADGVALLLKPMIEAGGPVVIDLSDVTFMDTTGIHVLVQAAEDLAQRGCLIVHGARGGVSEVITLTQLGSLRPNIHIMDCEVLQAGVA
jgi:anti-anti-sigma factor